MLATLQQGLRLNGVDPVYFSIVTGLCIVAGVVFDRKIQQLALRGIRKRGKPGPTPPAPAVPAPEAHLLGTGKQD